VRVAALLALLSSLSWGVADFIGGLAARRAGSAQVLAVTYPAGGIVITIFALTVIPGELSTGLIGYALVTGIIGSIAIALLYAALTRGQMGIVSPITAVMSGAVPVIVGVLRGEQPSTWAYLGMHSPALLWFWSVVSLPTIMAELHRLRSSWRLVQESPLVFISHRSG